MKVIRIRYCGDCPYAKDAEGWHCVRGWYRLPDLIQEERHDRNGKPYTACVIPIPDWCTLEEEARL